MAGLQLKLQTEARCENTLLTDGKFENGLSGKTKTTITQLQTVNLTENIMQEILFSFGCCQVAQICQHNTTD